MSGGTIYDRHLVSALRDLGARVEAFPFVARQYVAMTLENLRKPPQFPCHVWLQDELGHPGFLLRQGTSPRAGLSPSPLRVALVHNLRSLAVPASTGVPWQTHARRHVVRTLERVYLSGVGAWVAVCRDTLDEMHRLLGGRPEPASLVLYAGKDHAPAISDGEMERGARPPGGLNLLSVATVAPHKGTHRLLDLLSDTPALAAATLTLVGSCEHDPSYVHALRETCRTRGLETRVRFLGALKGEALWAAYRAADVFVLPSDREAYPLTGVEALGFALPLLLTARGGTGELITHGREGFLLSPDEPRAWAEALTHLADPQARRPFQHAARALHQALPRWRDTAATLLAFLNDVVPSPPQRETGRTHPGPPHAVDSVSPPI